MNFELMLELNLCLIMKRINYIIIIAAIAAVSCTSGKELQSGRDERKVKRAEMVSEAVRSDMYIVKIEKMYGRGGRMFDMVPSRNYIVVNHDEARMNFGYSGRSMDIMQISGINMHGKVVDRKLKTGKHGQFDIDMKIRENNDVFDVNITVGTNGYCDIGISHPRIDYARYRGQLYRLNMTTSQ